LLGDLPDDLVLILDQAYADLEQEYGSDASWAVRSSATAEDLPDVGRRVGTDQKDILPSFGELNGGGTGYRGLADAALAREKEIARWMLKEFHDYFFRIVQQQPRLEQQPVAGLSASVG
jgi:phosphoenolpyruvate synthase/pyruvate phosphate dikinase